MLKGRKEENTMKKIIIVCMLALAAAFSATACTSAGAQNNCCQSDSATPDCCQKTTQNIPDCCAGE